MKPATIQLKTGEFITVDDRIRRPPEGVFVTIDGHRAQVSGKTVADCLDTFAAQFKMLAIELEQMALAHRGAIKAAYPPDCKRCKDKGVIETGNNDFPCDCAAGDHAMFNSEGRLQTGAEIKARRR
jgi:hypothetical protein